jgi:PAS domain S-box-containing protein
MSAMSLFLFSAFALSLLFAAVIGSWYGGVAVYATFIALGLGGVGVLAAARWLDKRRRHAKARSSMADARWASEVCGTIPTAAAIVRGPVVSFANRALLDLLGLAERGDEVVGLPFTNVLHPGDHERFAAMLGSPSDGAPRGQDQILRLVRGGSGALRVYASLSPLESDPGSHLLQFSVDLSAGEAREVSGEGLVGAIDQLDLVFFKIDDIGRMVYANRAWERLTGRALADSRGRSLLSAVHPEDRDALEQGLARVANGNIDRFSTEVRFVHLAGNVLRGTLRANACFDAGGDLSGIAGTISEVDRRRREDESQASRRHVNTLLANVPGMIYRGLNDPDWTMEFVSDGCLDLTGYESWEIVGNRRVTFVSLIHPEDRDFVWSQVQAALEVRRPYQIAYRLVHASGRTLRVWEQGRGMFSAQGELLSVEGFITDMDIRSSTEERTRNRVWFDARTGMASRSVFTQLLVWTLHQSRIRNLRFALLWVDVNVPALQAIAFSSEVAENLLDTVARRFRSVNGPGALVTYMEDWRFAVLLSDFRADGGRRQMTAARDVVGATTRIAQGLAAELSTSVMVAGAQEPVEVAIGIALSGPRHIDAESLLSAARQASLQARALGPVRCEFSED